MVINSYDFGHIIIDGKRYNRDLIIFPGWIKAGWWRKDGHRLQVEDLEEVLAAKPEVLVVGTGYYGEMIVPELTRKHVQSEGIKLFVQKTAEATQTFNRLTESRKVVAVLHLTC
ncbi:MAG: Mth938-like domain-containing protein [Candidatus Hermodarchaeota archaeon]